MNTEVAVLNKIGAAAIVSLRNAQDTNKLLVAMAEQEVVSAKRQRDSEAVTVNNHIRYMAQGRVSQQPEGRFLGRNARIPDAVAKEGTGSRCLRAR